MAALTADRDAQRQEGELISYPVAGSTTIYKGSIVCDNGSGYATPGTESTNAFLGFAFEQVANSSATAGAKSIKVWKKGSFVVNKASAGQTDIGTLMYIRDDNTVAASTTNSNGVGYVVEVPSSSTVRILIDNYVK